MPESVSDSNGVKRKNDSQQDAQDVLSTSPPQPLLSSFLDKKNSDQEFLDNHDEKKVCSKTKPRSYRCSKCRQQGHNARTCPNVGKNDAANSETKCKRKFIRKESKVEPINNATQVVAKPVSNRLKHKTCNTCGISFRKNAKGKTSDRCLKCRIVDNYHPPIRIPQEIHPTKCNEFAFVFQRFLDQLCKGKYAINIIWEFFGSFCPPFEQNFVNISEDLTNIAPRNQSSEKLSKIFEDKCFDNKWSKALSALSPGVKAPNNENTIDKLKILHPYEDPIMDQNFYGTYWENYPLMPSEVFSVIKKRPRGKSAGLSNITIDHVKAAIISSEDCLGLLTKFFNQILSGQRKYPEELRSSRLTALVKNSKMDVRPIAVSESLHNIFSACCLSRFNEKAKKILLPFQYGINTTDGVSSAIFATDVLFRQNESNVCMSLDFSNAFNSLSRRSIHGALLQYMSELIPYFQSTYCTYSNLHFGNNILSSSSGVKQGDPLGPLLFFPNCSPYLYELSCELEKLPPQIWTKCFPQSIQEIPNRSLFNLQFCCKKLQQKLSKIFESLDFDVRLGLAKKKNPAFANLLQDMCDSTSSALVTTIPQVYGTLLSDSAWTLNMRFRSFIWPDNLPHNLICKCSREITTTHLLNCKHFITFRSKVHDAVRDQLYCMCKSHRIESFLEPLLSNLFDAENDFHKNNRGDVILPGLDGSFILLDVMSVDPCNASNERLVNSEIHNPLSNAENFKFKNTMNLCPNWPVYSMQNTICIHLYFPFLVHLHQLLYVFG
ncbi:hypothetical protein P9112_013619 [Eukaryota sp. TZLM1-RC]